MNKNVVDLEVHLQFSHNIYPVMTTKDFLTPFLLFPVLTLGYIQSVGDGSLANIPNANLAKSFP